MLVLDGVLELLSVGGQDRTLKTSSFRGGVADLGAIQLPEPGATAARLPPPPGPSAKPALEPDFTDPPSLRGIEDGLPAFERGVPPSSLGRFSEGTRDPSSAITGMARPRTDVDSVLADIEEADAPIGIPASLLYCILLPPEVPPWSTAMFGAPPEPDPRNEESEASSAPPSAIAIGVR